MTEIRNILSGLTSGEKIPNLLYRWPISSDDAFVLLKHFYKEEVGKRNRNFKEADFVYNAITIVARMLTNYNSARFGALFCGLPGGGKTTLLRAIQQANNYLRDRGHINREWGMRLTTATELCSLARAQDNDFSTLQNYTILGIDDAGREPIEVKSFGNALNPIVETLEKRYAEQLTTFITSNYPAPKIQELYGARVGDRLREMCEFVPFTNEKSFRL